MTPSVAASCRGIRRFDRGDPPFSLSSMGGLNVMTGGSQAFIGILSVPAAWVAIALLGLLRARSIAWVGRVLFPLGAVAGLALGILSLSDLAQPAQSLKIGRAHV